MASECRKGEFDSTLSELLNLNGVTQGSPSGNRDNPGLSDSIPSGLADRYFSAVMNSPFLSAENSEEPPAFRYAAWISGMNTQ